MTYIVKKGDTLSGIAKVFNTTVENLVENNDIKDPDMIYVGQVIIVPDKNDNVGKCLKECLSAIETLPEFKTLVKLLNG